jgi:hypothetical protein
MPINNIFNAIPVIKYILLLNLALKRNLTINKSKNIMNPVNSKPVRINNITLQKGPKSAHLDQYKRSNIENGIIIERIPRKQYIPDIKNDLNWKKID